jgi:iron complex transport system substrate-binding protein
VIRTLALAACCTALAACGPESEPSASDDGTPVRRVVTFAPHLAEIMFEVGAADQLVGVSAWSDYPRAVLELPEVGDAFTVDQEQLSLLQPDLVLVWASGMPVHTVDDLRQRGYRVESITTRKVADVAAAMRRVGEMTGHAEEAESAAMRFEAVFDELRQANADAEPISVFFQISARPLYTINREHFISEIIAVCGGQSIFDELDEFAPPVSVEAVLDRDPEVMLAGANLGEGAFEEWQRWPDMAANRLGNQFLLPDETVGRPSPRLTMAARSVCLALDQGRANRREAQ